MTGQEQPFVLKRKLFRSIFGFENNASKILSLGIS